MGLLAFGLFMVLVLAIAALLVWLAGTLAPGHPALIDNGIWALAGALGLHDVPIPRVFGR